LFNIKNQSWQTRAKLFCRNLK